MDCLGAVRSGECENAVAFLILDLSLVTFLLQDEYLHIDDNQPYDDIHISCDGIELDNGLHGTSFHRSRSFHEYRCLHFCDIGFEIVCTASIQYIDCHNFERCFWACLGFSCSEACWFLSCNNNNGICGSR